MAGSGGAGRGTEYTTVQEEAQNVTTSLYLIFKLLSNHHFLNPYQ